MSNTLNFTLKPDTVGNIHAFSELLKKDVSTLLEEALDEYFVNVQKKLLEKNISDESAMTNLDYDEFWDGLEDI
jgi:NH3-dependent NAD+ synthetase